MDADWRATTAREVHEELGIVALRFRRLGTLVPDSGLFSNAVEAVEVDLPVAPPALVLSQTARSCGVGGAA